MIFLSLLLQISTFASTSHSDYMCFSEVKKETQAQWASQSAATTPLQVKNGHYCSAVFVGPNGEALTNLHCIESCLEASGLVDREKIPGSQVEIFRPKAGGNCLANIKPEAGVKLEEVNVQILKVIGPGWIAPRENLSDFINTQREFAMKLLNEGFEGAGDLALIRLPRAGACVALGEAAFDEAQPLTNLAYPILMRKPDDNPMSPVFITIGTAQLFSQGLATKNPEVFRQLAPTFPGLEDYLPFYFLRGVLISATDSEPGSSGSPLFNSQGKLVALTRSTWKGNASKYVPWTTQAVDLTLKREEIQSLIPNYKSCL